MTVYDYREITLKDDLCLEISRDTDIENPRENDCNAATFYCLKSPRRKIGDIIDSAYYLNETKRTLAKTGEYAILPIYIYEHSGIALCTVPFSDIWDSACIGFAVANINDFMKQRISDTPVSRCEAMHRAEDCIRNELEAYGCLLRLSIFPVDSSARAILPRAMPLAANTQPRETQPPASAGETYRKGGDVYVHCICA